MTQDVSSEIRLLIQADHDDELTPAEAARVHADAAHIAAALQSLSARIRAEIPCHPAPEPLRQAVAAFIARTGPAGPRPLALGSSFGAGFALAACLALVVLLPRNDPALTGAVVADHIRSLQPGHLTDVLSTDQHTVKPWFDGRLDFAPPVKDLQADGFPLAGGRLDYLEGREVAALLYRRRQHIVQLFVWPDRSSFDSGPHPGARQGYNVVHWNADGIRRAAARPLNRCSFRHSSLNGAM